MKYIGMLVGFSVNQLAMEVTSVGDQTVTSVLGCMEKEEFQ